MHFPIPKQALITRAGGILRRAMLGHSSPGPVLVLIPSPLDSGGARGGLDGQSFKLSRNPDVIGDIYKKDKN